MFKKSEIGERCDCGVPHDVVKEHKFKRFLVPKGDYGKFWYPAKYYAALWWTLRCQQCGNVRDDFIIYHWSSDGSYAPLMPPFAKDYHAGVYTDVRNAILAQFPD